MLTVVVTSDFIRTQSEYMKKRSEKGLIGYFQETILRMLLFTLFTKNRRGCNGLSKRNLTSSDVFPMFLLPYFSPIPGDVSENNSFSLSPKAGTWLLGK